MPTSSSEDPSQVPDVDVANEINLVDAKASDSNKTPSDDNVFCEDVETSYDPAGFSQTDGRFVVLDDPVMIAVEQATWLDSDKLVLGVEKNV